VTRNEKTNPYADSGAWSDTRTIPANTLLAVANGTNEFMGTAWTGGRWSSSADRKQTMATSKGGGIGVDKSYKGYGASGLYNVKRIAEVADVAYVLNVDALNARLSSTSVTAARDTAKRGATALIDPKKFKDENLARYRQILADRVSSNADALDGMVEKAIAKGSELISAALKKKEMNRYGEMIVGLDPRGRDVKFSDVANWMKNVLDDYSRYCSYVEQSKESSDSGYYAREAKNYALNTKQRIQKIDKLDIAW
jgi:hypothetical protein